MDPMLSSVLMLVVMSLVPKLLEALSALAQSLEMAPLLKAWFVKQHKHEFRAEAQCTATRGGNRQYSIDYEKTLECIAAVQSFLLERRAASRELRFQAANAEAVPFGRVTYGELLVNFADSETESEARTTWRRSVTISTDREREHITSFLQECLEHYEAKLARVKQPYFYQQQPSADGSGCRWMRHPLRVATSWDDLFYPEKEELQAAIEQLGPTQKLSLLLHGPPGTGKTSTIKAIAKATGRHVINIDLTLTTNNQELLSIFFGKGYWRSEEGGSFERPTADKCIFVLEEIDTQLERLAERSRTTAQMKPSKEENDTASKGSSSSSSSSLMDIVKLLSERLTLGGLLTALDGLLELHNTIVVMNTNHPEKLDPRLVRPGRVTHEIYLGPFSTGDAVALVQRKFPKATAARLPLLAKRAWVPAELKQHVARSATLDQLAERLRTSSEKT